MYKNKIFYLPSLPYFVRSSRSASHIKQCLGQGETGKSLPDPEVAQCMPYF